MILGDKKIRELAKEGMITPFKEKNLSPASYDLTMGDEFKNILEQSWTVDPTMGMDYIETSPFMHPEDFMLVVTKEYFKLPPNVAGLVVGRSSIGRAGIQITNAGFIDPGFEGNITLQLFNQNPNVLELQNLDRIAQIIFFEVDGSENTYNGKYQGEEGLIVSRLIDDLK